MEATGRAPNKIDLNLLNLLSSSDAARICLARWNLFSRFSPPPGRILRIAASPAGIRKGEVICLQVVNERVWCGYKMAMELLASPGTRTTVHARG